MGELGKRGTGDAWGRNMRLSCAVLRFMLPALPSVAFPPSSTASSVTRRSAAAAASLAVLLATGAATSGANWPDAAMSMLSASMRIRVPEQAASPMVPISLI